MQPTQRCNPLTAVDGRLGLRTLSTLLADDTALGGVGSSLGLLRLLSGGGSSLLLLGLLNGLSASSRAGLGAHGAALLDHIEGSTNDGTLGLDGAASTLLGNLL